jgi:hypothetical protein
MAKQKKGTSSKSGAYVADVDEYMEIFAWAFKKTSSDAARIVSLQQSYDNVFLESAWPTVSKVPIAAFYEATSKAVPLALDGIFSPSNRIRLHPTEEGVAIDQIQRAETALHDQVMYRMKAHRNSIPVVNDVFKCGVGFSIVEPFYFSLPSSFQLTTGGKTTRVMQVSESRLGYRMRYVTPGQVVVTPDGSNFNSDCGGNPVSVAFLFDSYNENQLRDMYNSSVLDGEKPELLGDVETVIEEARSQGFTSDTSIETLVKQTGGIAPSKLKPDDARVPCRVPVLKCYDTFKRRHLWIANGTTIIYDKADEFQTMRCPLIKATAWMDSTRFYPMSTPEAFQKIGWTKNIIINLFLDILTKQLKRPLIYNQDFFDKEPTFGPDDRIRTTAPDARLGATYLEGPTVQPTTLTFYEYVNQLGASLTGQRDFMEKNFTRGGGMAFNDLLATTEGMSRLQWTILEMTFIESLINNALIFLQSSVEDKGYVVQKRKLNKTTNKEEFESVTITENDLVHGYEASLDLGEKKRFGSIESQMSLAVYDRKIQSPYFRHEVVSEEMLCSSPEEAERQLKPAEEIRAIQERAQQAAEQERAAALAEAQGGVPGANPSQEMPQGMAGEMMGEMQ